MPYSIIEPGVRKWDILQRSELDPLSNNEFDDITMKRRFFQVIPIFAGTHCKLETVRLLAKTLFLTCNLESLAAIFQAYKTGVVRIKEVQYLFRAWYFLLMVSQFTMRTYVADISV